MEGNTGDYLLWALVGVLIVVGLVGAILPALPGIPLIFAGLFLAAYLGNFERIGWPTLTILAALTALAITADFVAALLGAKRAGASKLALLGAAVGSVLGVFSGLWGLIIFPFVGAVLGELITRQKLNQASRVGIATWLGMMMGILAKLAIALTMLGIFVIAYFIK